MKLRVIEDPEIQQRFTDDDRLEEVAIAEFVLDDREDFYAVATVYRLENGEYSVWARAHNPQHQPEDAVRVIAAGVLKHGIREYTLAVQEDEFDSSQGFGLSEPLIELLIDRAKQIEDQS